MSSISHKGNTSSAYREVHREVLGVLGNIGSTNRPLKHAEDVGMNKERNETTETQRMICAGLSAIHKWCATYYPGDATTLKQAL